MAGIHRALSVVCTGGSVEELEQNWQELTSLLSGKDMSPYPAIQYRAAAKQYRVVVDQHLG